VNYYISDLHLFHESCIRFDDRPFESLDAMHEAIGQNGTRKSQTETPYLSLET